MCAHSTAFRFFNLSKGYVFCLFGFGCVWGYYFPRLLQVKLFVFSMKKILMKPGFRIPCLGFDFHNNYLLLFILKLVFLKTYASAAMSKDLDLNVLSSIANLRMTTRKLQAEEMRLSTELASRKAHIRNLLRENR